MGVETALLGGLLLSGAGALSGHIAQNKARAQARHQMGLQMQEAQRQRELAQQQFDAKMREDARIHADNMQQARNALAANAQQFAAQQAQAQQGLAMQQAAMAEQKAQADRNFAMQQAQAERNMSAQVKQDNVATFKRPDRGAAGTILTGALGVDKDKLQKGNRLLGGV